MGTYQIIEHHPRDIPESYKSNQPTFLLGEKRIVAHHIIPWDKQTHDIVQKAAKKNGTNPFHMNDALNGIPVASWRNQPNHNAYNNLIRSKLDAIPNNLTPDEAYSRLMDIVNDARQAIVNNPNTHLNDLIF